LFIVIGFFLISSVLVSREKFLATFNTSIKNPVVVYETWAIIW